MRQTDSISRQVSTNAVMTAVLHHGPISRADISRETGLSKQTASDIVRTLESQGWIEEVGIRKGNIGRTAVLYQVVPDAAYIIGIDLGGTKVTAAIADMTCSLVAEATELTHKGGGRHVTDQIVNLCRSLAKRAGIAWSKVRLGVMGMPGVVDPQTGFVDYAPNIPGVADLAVRDVLCDGLGINIVIENDVNLAVIGERWRGAGQGIDNLAFIALGTGIGQGIVLNGNLVRGARGAAGEISYLPVGSDPFGDHAKTSGAFENAVGTQAILDRYRRKNGRAATVQELFKLVADGETAAIETLDETARILALGVVATAALFDPQTIIFGGSIGARSELVSRIRDVLPTCMSHPIPIEVSALGPRATIMGTLAVGLNTLHETVYGTQLPHAELTLPRPEEERAKEAVQ